MATVGPFFTYGQLMSLWENAGGNPLYAPVAAAIAMAESSGGQNSTNLNSNGTVDRGLWQINSMHTQFDSNELLANPMYNAQAAVALSGGTQSNPNFSPWATYNTGAYKQPLSEYAGTKPAPIDSGSASAGNATTTTRTNTGPSQAFLNSKPFYVFNPNNWFKGDGPLTGVLQGALKKTDILGIIENDVSTLVQQTMWFALAIIMIAGGLLWIILSGVTETISSTVGTVKGAAQQVVPSIGGGGGSPKKKTAVQSSAEAAGDDSMLGDIADIAIL